MKAYEARQTAMHNSAELREVRRKIKEAAQAGKVSIEVQSKEINSSVIAMLEHDGYNVQYIMYTHSYIIKW